MITESRNVSKRFGDFVAARRRLACDVARARSRRCSGRRAAGKSTLLRIIAGLEGADAGRVVIEGDDVTRLPPQKRDIGFVFQHYAAFKHMTVRDNIAFAMTIRRRPKARAARPGRRAPRARPARRARRPLSGAALGRAAPAHGARAGARGPAARPAARRALRGPGRAGARRAARVAAAAARRRCPSRRSS